MQILLKISSAIDAGTELLGRLCGLLVMLLVFLTLAVVILRYGFDMGFVWMQELYVWLYGCVFLAGAGYALKYDQHVRVDIIYAKASDTYQSWVNILGTLFLLWPMLIFVSYYAYPYVMDSWVRDETSFQSGGMPMIYLYKSMLLIFTFNLFMQSLSLVMKSILKLKGLTS